MPRIRDNSTFLFQPFTAVTTVDGLVTHTSTGTFSCRLANVMVDVSTPKYSKLSGEGKIINSPMEKYTTAFAPLPVNYWKARNNFPQIHRWTQDYIRAYTDESPWLWEDVKSEVDRLEILAITSAYAKVGEPDLATLTELAELKETIGFLLSPLRSFIKVTKSVRSHNERYNRWYTNKISREEKWAALPPHIRARRKKPVFSEPPKLKLGKFEATDISSAWLAYRYAIMPIVYSIQDIMKHLERVSYPERQTSRAKETGEINSEHHTPEEDNNHPTGYTLDHYSRSGAVRIKVRAGVLYETDWSLSRQLGVQLHQIPAAAYEIIPLSFVTDWLHNGKDVYNALTAELRSGKILSAWVTSEIEYDFRVRLYSRPYDIHSACSGDADIALASGKWKRRRPASLSDVRLRLRVDMNSKRVADAFALAHVILTSTFKRK